MKKKRIRKEKPCQCGICVPPADSRRAVEPTYGYYLDEVPFVHCARCDTPIGDRPYEENRMLARFGTMLFNHKECRPEDLQAAKERDEID